MLHHHALTDMSWPLLSPSFAEACEIHSSSSAKRDAVAAPRGEGSSGGLLVHDCTDAQVSDTPALAGACNAGTMGSGDEVLWLTEPHDDFQHPPHARWKTTTCTAPTMALVPAKKYGPSAPLRLRDSLALSLEPYAAPVGAGLARLYHAG